MYLSILHLSMNLCYLFFYQSNNQSINQSAYVSINLSRKLSIYRSIYLPIYLSVYLSTHVFDLFCRSSRCVARSRSVYLFPIHLSLYLHTALFTYLTVCLSISRSFCGVDDPHTRCRLLCSWTWLLWSLSIYLSMNLFTSIHCLFYLQHASYSSIGLSLGPRIIYLSTFPLSVCLSLLSIFLLDLHLSTV